ncbi:alpha/beta fold hydrolase [Nocardia sp. NPDC052566]|uniref:alpha/beta fold hydrolase n=1 Tax=Nocardia sp. NPDC052566 TaxID=3364330 RepID=UPI0037CBD9BD
MTVSDAMIVADGVSMHVRTEGPAAAKAVVLIHGFGGSLHWFDRLAPMLATTFRVVRADLRGHGRTGGDTGLEPESQARTIAAVLDSLEIADAAAFGHSFGADIALALARRSDRVREAGIIGQAPDYSYANFPPGAVIMTVPILGPLLHRLTPPIAIRLGLRAAFARGYRFDDAFDRRDQPVRDYRAMHPAVYRETVTARRTRLAADPLDAQLRALPKPAMVLHGDSDQMYDPAKTIARYAATDARVEVVAGAGHSPNVERPAEVARLIREFLTPPTTSEQPS